jgi:hypothetical protein
MRKIFYSILIIAVNGCSTIFDFQSNHIDRDKWGTSSSYRYEIVKKEDFSFLKGKSKEYVINIFGEPDLIQENDFIYCLDIPFQNEDSLSGKCKASFLVINFEEGNPFNVTVVNVEPIVSE